MKVVMAYRVIGALVCKRVVIGVNKVTQSKVPHLGIVCKLILKVDVADWELLPILKLFFNTITLFKFYWRIYIYSFYSLWIYPSVIIIYYNNYCINISHVFNMNLVHHLETSKLNYNYTFFVHVNMFAS